MLQSTRRRNIEKKKLTKSKFVAKKTMLAMEIILYNISKEKEKWKKEMY